MASPYKINKSTSITNNSGSTSKTTGALTVTGGIASQENIILGGYLGITGTSNIVNLKVQNATSAYNYNLPSSSGSSGEILASGGGGSNPMTWKSVTGSGSIVMSFAPTFGAGTVTFGGSIDVSANTNSQSATFSNYIGITGTSASYSNKRITSSSDHSLLFCADRATVGSYSFWDSTATTNYININTTTSMLEVKGATTITGALSASSIQNTPIGSTTASTGSFTDLAVTQNNSSFDGILRVINTTTLSSSIANFLTPSLASGNGSVIIWGKTNSSNQAAYISFGYDSTATAIYSTWGFANASPANSISLRGDGTISLNGATSITGALSSTGQITTTISTGTSPFSVASTTVVPNLNVSQLLGSTWASPGAIGSTTPNTGSFTTLSSTGQITTDVSTGTPPFSVASTTVVPNLNVSQLLGSTWTSPGTIGSTTPNTGSFTTLSTSGLINVNLPGSASGIPLSAYIPSLSNGNSVQLYFGVASTTNNTGIIQFNYTSSGSTSNSIGLGLYGANNIMNITSAGNVGIGTTSPGSSLHVAGSIPVSPIGNGVHQGIDSSNYAAIQLNSSVGGYIDFGTSGGDYQSRITSTSGNITLQSNSGSGSYIHVSNGGIGINNTNPSYALDVTGAGRFTGAVTTGILNTEAITANGGGSTISETDRTMRLGNGGSGGNYLYIGYTAANIGWLQNTYFGFNAFYSMLLNPLGGNVGIGNTSPSYTLDVTGAGRFTGGISVSGINAIGVAPENSIFGANSGTNNSIKVLSAIGNIEIGVTNGSGAFVTTANSGDAFITTKTGKGLVIQSNAGLGAYSYISNGGIGINNISPSYALDVTGTGRFTGPLISSDLDTGIVTANGGGSTISEINRTMRIGNGGSGGNHLYIGYTAANVCWLQNTYFGFNAFYNMLLNPLGGNVGIGNTSPTYTLDVTGTGRFTGGISVTGINATGVAPENSIFGANSGTVNSIKVLSAIGNIEIGVSNGSGSFVSTSNSGDAFVKANTSKGIVLQGNAGAGAYTYISNGGIGINNITPAHALDVNGSLSVSNGTVRGKTITVGGSTNNVIISTSGSFQFFISWNSGAGYAFGFITSSNSTTTIIHSSNSAGGNSSIDTVNGFTTNGSDGISIFYNVGDIVLQTKVNYSGGAITTTLIGA